ncbi:twin-arginine translocase TatA/TatE family subunit [bacterium]|nr:twin-arginine translocase TatA/TatE family subunit [bacterium]
MFSVSPAEIMTIAIIGLLVFGPRRLPEIAKRAGKVIAELRSTASTLKTDLEREYGDTLDPLTEARREMEAAIGDVQKMAAPPIPSPSRPTTPDAESSDEDAPAPTADTEEPPPPDQGSGE